MEIIKLQHRRKKSIGYFSGLPRKMEWVDNETESEKERKTKKKNLYYLIILSCLYVARMYIVVI
jgi:hypothetical protein